jgi:hypothetical protein
MSTSINDVNAAVDTFASGASAAFASWQEVVATVEETTGSDLNSITSKVNEVTSASDALAAALLGEDGTGGLISELKDGFKEVGKAIEDALGKWSGFNITVSADTSSTDEGGTTVPSGGSTGFSGPGGKTGIHNTTIA